MMTVSRTEKLSYMFWFCFKTDMRRLGSSTTLPEVGSSSPERILIKVDFPAPFAPIMP